VAETNSLQQLLQQGIAAARRGDRAAARQLLEAVIARDAENELAWIWLASAVPTERERRICLEKVLQMNPGNARAREALLALGPAAPRPAAAPPVPPPARPNRLLLSLGVIGGVLALMIGLPLLFTPPIPQVTPLPRTFAPVVSFATPTTTLVPTFAGVIVTRDPGRVTLLPPTFTPTATATALPTLTFTPTPIPLRDFTLLVAAREAGQPQPVLYRAAGDGSAEQMLAEGVSDPAFDATGDQIAFVREVVYPADESAGTPATAAGEIFIAPLADPAAAQQITTLRTHSARTPVFHPRGREILFVSDYDGDDELWLIDPVTGITTQLTFNTTADRDPAWSPDASTIVFSSDRDTPGLPELYRLDYAAGPGAFEADENHDSGYTVTRLTQQDGSSYAPAWSPDGTQIVFVNDQSSTPDLYLTNVAGTRIQRLLPLNAADNRAPAWSPDGRLVVFISNRENDRFQVYTFDITGRVLTRLTQDNRDAQRALFRPEARVRQP
jgi:hypothetical protein